MNWLDRRLWIEPLWVLGLGYLVLLLLACGVGVLMGRARREPESSGPAPVATVQAALLGLLALLLAFTYAQAAARYDLRRRLLVDEANAIGTVWLRASFLPVPERAELREQLRQYANLRVISEESRLNLAAARRRARASEALQTKMWETATRPTQTRSSTPYDALLIGSLNELIDLHTSRVASYRDRVPLAVLVLLALVSVMSMALMGFSFGQARRANYGFLVVLAVAVAAVTLSILDLDQSHRGWTRISQSSLQQLGPAELGGPGAGGR